MLDEVITLKGLLEAYIEGDTLARRALLDWLEERSDPRLQEVHDEAIDWDALVVSLISAKRSGWRRLHPLVAQPHSGTPEHNHTRWLIACARFGSDAPPHIAQAVRKARLQWLGQLFPEVEL